MRLTKGSLVGWGAPLLLCGCPQLLDDDFTWLSTRADGVGGSETAPLSLDGGQLPDARAIEVSDSGGGSGGESCCGIADAGRVSDAAKPGDADAGNTPVGPDAASGVDAGSLADAGGSCGGARALGACWYLGDFGESCTQVCSQHGGFDPRSTALVGTEAQGGNGDNCAVVLFALSATSMVVREGSRVDGRGLGCHLFGIANPEPWWLRDPSFSADDSLASAERVCGCLE